MGSGDIAELTNLGASDCDDTYLTDDLIDRICTVIRTGCPTVTACYAVGMSNERYEKYIEIAKDEDRRVHIDGEKPRSECYMPLKFYSELMKAEAHAEISMVRVIIKAAREKNTWQAALSYLERTRPEVWNKASYEIKKAEKAKALDAAARKEEIELKIAAEKEAEELKQKRKEKSPAEIRSIFDTVMRCGSTSSSSHSKVPVSEH